MSMSSVKRLAIKGIFWTIAGDGITQIIRFGSHLILTRLLVPELFDLVSLAYLLIAVVNVFSDIGLKLSIIQNQRGENQEFLNTAWTMQVIRSFFIGLCVILVTLPVANFYKEPGLLWLMPVLAINTIIGGFNWEHPGFVNIRISVK
jgi:O-antigen/teichoic acid export membrane protein